MDEREEIYRLAELAMPLFIHLINRDADNPHALYDKSERMNQAVWTATQMFRLSAKAIADEKERISKEVGVTMDDQDKREYHQQWLYQHSLGWRILWIFGLVKTNREKHLDFISIKRKLSEYNKLRDGLAQARFELCDCPWDGDPQTGNSHTKECAGSFITEILGDGDR